jgi:alpha-mannosidase
MWLKQRNAAAEALLTRWTEPATVWAWLLGGSYPTTQLELAWKFLMHNHPHDSICGCSIDQVHAEMMSRFAQSEQIAGELTTRALRALAARVEIRDPEAGVPVVVFNAATGPRTEVVHCAAQLGFSQFEVVNGQGKLQPHQVVSRHGAELFNQTADKELVMGMLGIIGEGNVFGYAILDAHVGPRGEDGQVQVEVVVAERGTPNRKAVERLLTRARDLAQDDLVTTFHIVAREATTTEMKFLATDVPAYGGRLFFLRPRGSLGSTALGEGDPPVRIGPNWIENTYLRVEIDAATGTAVLTDKTTGQVYSGLNRLLDSGDVGDLYNYCPPQEDRLVDTPAEPPSLEVLESGPACATLRLRETYRLPERCDSDRGRRASTEVDCTIVLDMSLDAGSRRVECTCSVDNNARDHRLRILFPVPFVAPVSDAESTFEITRRSSELRAPSPPDQPWSEWIEMPVNTHPQKRFVDVTDGEYGLAVLNRGLAEYEVVRTSEHGSAIALTLLRCTEWLSRDDLSTRRGHAGPHLYTPDAQGVGHHVFEYALVPHAGTWATDDAFVLRQAGEFESPLRSTVVDQHAGDRVLPEAWSFVRVEPASVIVSALTRSLDGEALILRLCNPLADKVDVDVTLAIPFDEVDIVDLLEEPSSRGTTTPLARILSNAVHTTLRGGEMQTLRFRM